MLKIARQVVNKKNYIKRLRQHLSRANADNLANCSDEKVKKHFSEWLAHIKYEAKKEAPSYSALEVDIIHNLQQKNKTIANAHTDLFTIDYMRSRLKRRYQESTINVDIANDPINQSSRKDQTFELILDDETAYSAEKTAILIAHYLGFPEKDDQFVTSYKIGDQTLALEIPTPVGEPMTVGDKTCLGLFQLIPGESTALNTYKTQLETLLQAALAKAKPLLEQGNEITLPLLTYSPTEKELGCGHYRYFKIVKDDKAPGYTLNHIDSLSTTPNNSTLLTIERLAKDAGINITNTQAKTYLHQSSTLGCGPSLVETIRRDMCVENIDVVTAPTIELSAKSYEAIQVTSTCVKALNKEQAIRYEHGKILLDKPNFCSDQQNIKLSHNDRCVLVDKSNLPKKITSKQALLHSVKAMIKEQHPLSPDENTQLLEKARKNGFSEEKSIQAFKETLIAKRNGFAKYIKGLSNEELDSAAVAIQMQLEEFDALEKDTTRNKPST